MDSTSISGQNKQHLCLFLSALGRPASKARTKCHVDYHKFNLFYWCKKTIGKVIVKLVFFIRHLLALQLIYKRTWCKKTDQQDRCHKCIFSVLIKMKMENYHLKTFQTV